MRVNRLSACLVAVVSAACVFLLLAAETALATSSGSQVMYRLYNKHTGEHFYTADAAERDNLVEVGWDNEGEGWVAPKRSSTPVYRLYNSYVAGGNHHYTTDAKEKAACIAAGWTDEGIGWYSDDAHTASIYREYNPNAKTGTHNYTGDKDEHDWVVALGWRDEGVAWYALEVKELKVNVSNAADRTSHAIMGTSLATAQQMAAYYKWVGYAFPSSTYASKGAANIEQFAQIAYEEATAEGVRAEVVFCQMMWETGWLQFGGDVLPEQCNFGGLGATGNGVRGNSFPDVRTGIRAQVQHLKAYASTEPLNNACVDSRFGYVTRGRATTIEGLSGTWAADKMYGTRIYNMVQGLLEFGG